MLGVIYAMWHLLWVSFMLSVSNKPLLLSVIKPNVCVECNYVEMLDSNLLYSGHSSSDLPFMLLPLPVFYNLSLFKYKLFEGMLHFFTMKQHVLSTKQWSYIDRGRHWKGTINYYATKINLQQEKVCFNKIKCIFDTKEWLKKPFSVFLNNVLSNFSHVELNSCRNCSW